MNTPLLKKLLSDRPEMEKDLEDFNQQYREFLKKDDSSIGAILRCHLLVEHFLDRYIEAANPSIQKFEDARLSFAQKLVIADHPKSIVHAIMPSLRALNRLRNHLAHKLSASFDETLLGPINEFMTTWNKAGGYPVPKGIRMVEEFALLASGWLYGSACTIRRHSPKSGLLGLLEWYSDTSAS